MISIFQAVGVPFLDRLISTPIEGSYLSSYPSVAFSFLLKLLFIFLFPFSFCDVPSLQLDIAKLITSILKVLRTTTEDDLRRDAVMVLSSLAPNPSIIKVCVLI